MKVRSRTRTWVGRLGLAVASLVLSLALAEAAVRLLDLGTDIMPVFNRSLTLSSNPVLGYELVPGSEDGKTVINPDGMRDRAYTLSKPDGTFRIACVGDSICYGYGVEQEEALPKQLERTLAHWLDRVASSAAEPGGTVSHGGPFAPLMPPPKPPPTRYEVLNFGVVGYNTVRIVESVRTKVLKYSPDLILYVYCLNDPQEYSFDQQSLLAQRGPAARNSRAREGRGLIERSRFLRTVMYMMRTAAEGKAIRRMPDWWRDDPQALSLQDASHVRYFSRLHSDPSTWAPVARALDGLAAMTRARRIPVVLPIVPMFFELEDVGSRLTKVRDRVALEASDRLFHPVDLFEPYAAHGRAGLPTLNLDATHLTVEGNRYTAMILAASLLGAGLLPREVSLRDVLASATLEDRYRVLLGRVLDPARTGSPAEPAKRVSPRPAEANLSR